MKKYYLITLAIFISFVGCSFQTTKKAKYDFTITQSESNNVTRFMINNNVTAPVIRAQMGETLVVKVNNTTKKELVIHWHGLLVPNNQDGVIGVTGPSIKPNESFTYQFPIKQTGTYWYHAHGLEEAQGIYGGIVLDSSKESDDPIYLFSGQLDKNPEDILSELTQGNMAGMDHSKMNMKNTKAPKINVMQEMSHFSDITYVKHLINGKEESPVIEGTNTNEPIKLRLVNAYADGFLNIVYSGGDIIIVGADGLDVKPWKTQNLRIAMGETYDILVNPAQGKQLELVAFFLGESNAYSKILIGTGDPEPLNSYNFNDFSITQPYAFLETFKPDFINWDNTASASVEHKMSLEGDHASYTWNIVQDAKILSELKLKVGDRLIFNITNNTAMPHPMHLHGQFFRVLNKNNRFLLKHTFNIDPSETIKMEIQVDEEGKWLFHCHNLFHMATGMMMVLDVASK